MNDKATGHNIRQHRTRKAWTQEHLAAAAALSVRTVQRAEEGATSAETLKAIAGALDVSVEALVAEAMPRITPVLYYDAPASLDWIVAAFGFEILERYEGPDGRIVHAELGYAEGRIMVGVPMPDHGWSTPAQLEGRRTQSMYVRVDDIDAHYARAEAAGATLFGAPSEAHGHRRYRAEDPEGHQWWFVQPTTRP